MRRAVASGLGLGFAPVAPGTVASAAAAFVGFWLLRWGLPALTLAGLAATVLGLWALARETGDPGWVVIDEVVGQWIALLTVPAGSVVWCAVAFALFRALDIGKPGPVGWADRPGTVGIMADDAVAGFLTAGLIGAARLAMEVA